MLVIQGGVMRTAYIITNSVYGGYVTKSFLSTRNFDDRCRLANKVTPSHFATFMAALGAWPTVVIGIAVDGRGWGLNLEQSYSSLSKVNGVGVAIPDTIG